MELEGHRDFKLATKIAASCLSLLPDQCVPFFLSFYFSLYKSLSDFNIYFYSNTVLQGHDNDMTEREEGGLKF